MQVPVDLAAAVMHGRSASVQLAEGESSWVMICGCCISALVTMYIATQLIPAAELASVLKVGDDKGGVNVKCTWCWLCCDLHCNSILNL